MFKSLMGSYKSGQLQQHYSGWRIRAMTRDVIKLYKTLKENQNISKYNKI